MSYQNQKINDTKRAIFMGVLLLTTSLQSQVEAKSSPIRRDSFEQQHVKGGSVRVPKNKKTLSTELEKPNHIFPQKPSKPKYDWEKKPLETVEEYRPQRDSYKKLFLRNIVQPIKDSMEDFIDNLKSFKKNVKKGIEREIMRPLKDTLEDCLK